MSLVEPIKVQGLAEFSRNLRKLDNDLPKALRVAMNGAADVVIGWARPRVPRRSGRAARSLRASSTRTAVRVTGGSARVPYYPWLDFGGGGRRGGRPPHRPFIKEGRYLWKGYAVKRHEVARVLEKALLDTAAQAGVEVT